MGKQILKVSFLTIDDYSGCSDPGFKWSVGVKEFAHPAIVTFSAVGSAGPTFFLAMAMFTFVFQISSLVREKELKLRQVKFLRHFFAQIIYYSPPKSLHIYHIKDL